MVGKQNESRATRVAAAITDGKNTSRQPRASSYNLAKQLGDPSPGVFRHLAQDAAEVEEGRTLQKQHTDTCRPC